MTHMPPNMGPRGHGAGLSILALTPQTEGGLSTDGTQEALTERALRMLTLTREMWTVGYCVGGS